MRLVIFAPAHPASAIGRASRLVNRSLVDQGHDVVSVATELPSLADGADSGDASKTVHWTNNNAVAAAIAGSDAVVFHIGDNHEFHAGAIEWLKRSGGLVCLHDFYLGNLFHQWANGRREEANRILERLYGQAVAHDFFGHGTIDEFIAATHEASPMTEWICEMASGVITHSEWGAPRVLASCGGPVAILPLAYEAPQGSTRSAATPRPDGARLQLLTLGNANSNKRIDSVLRAIGSRPELRERLAYRLVGAIEPTVAKVYQALADELGVTLTVSGQVSASELARALHDADIVSCLRWPTLEAASASAIEAMLLGKPTVVTDVGFYAELPDEAVIKVDPNDEIEQLATALLALSSDRTLRERVGAAAAAWAGATFRADKYAAGVVEAAREILRAGPAATAIARASDTLERWGCAGDPLVVDALVAPLDVFE